MKITAGLVHHLADLSRLGLDAAAAERFAAQLDTIVAAMAQLDSLDTREAPPSTQLLPLDCPLRADRAMPSDAKLTAALLANAPQRDDDRFRVPKIIE